MAIDTKEPVQTTEVANKGILYQLDVQKLSLGQLKTYFDTLRLLHGNLTGAQLRQRLMTDLDLLSSSDSDYSFLAGIGEDFTPTLEDELGKNLETGLLKVGPLTLDFNTRQIVTPYVADPKRLTPTELLIARTVMSNEGRVIPYSRLEEILSGYGSKGYVDRNSFKNHYSRLRKKAGDPVVSTQPLIHKHFQVVKDVGYLFNSGI